MQFVLDVKVLLLLVAANGTPVLAKKLLGDFLSKPLDAGRHFVDGQPLFGTSKTVRGVILSAIVTSICAPTVGFPWTTGLVVGLVAMVGDLVSSFTKRRLHLVQSSMALGLDQVPESLLPALVCMSLIGLTIVDVGLVVALFFAGELVLSRLLFRMRIRDRPY